GRPPPAAARRRNDHLEGKCLRPHTIAAAPQRRQEDAGEVRAAAALRPACSLLSQCWSCGAPVCRTARNPVADILVDLGGGRGRRDWAEGPILGIGRESALGAGLTGERIASSVSAGVA